MLESLLLHFEAILSKKKNYTKHYAAVIVTMSVDTVYSVETIV